MVDVSTLESMSVEVRPQSREEPVGKIVMQRRSDQIAGAIALRRVEVSDLSFLY